MDINRKTAFLILQDIEMRSAWSNLALNSHIAEEEPDSPSFVRGLVYGVLRNAFLLDHNIKALLMRPGSRLAAPESILLRMGLYQIACMDGVAPYAAVSETVELAKRFAKGRQSFINAVLRNFLRRGGQLTVPEKDRGEITFSCRPWIADLWRQAYGEESALKLMKESNRPAELSLRANLLKITREALMVQLPGTELDSLTKTALLASGGSLVDSQAYREGFFSIQSRMSQYAVGLLDPRPGETLVDLCAAPGGKSCAAAERMKDTGRVLAFDLHEKRVGLIEKEASRLGLTIIRASRHDALEPLPELTGCADRVLCDVPCSALGTLRRRPEIKLRDKPEDFDRLPVIQRGILTNGAALVRTGGRLLYATCTIDPAENEAVTGSFLAENKGFTRVFEKQFFPQEAGDGFYFCLMERRN